MNHRKLQAFFASRAGRGEPLALATVFETKGSTYSKAGARMLIDGNGIFQGMLSGGCLEGDLAIRAQVVLESGQAQFASYDLSSNDDELWGLGVGCDGLMRIFMQAITARQDYEPFQSISRLELGRERARAITVIESKYEGAPAGATLLLVDGHVQNFGFDDAARDAVTHAAQEAVACSPGVTNMLVGESALTLLDTPIQPVPRLLVLGAGLDAEPVVRLAAEVGWLCTVADHRPAYIDNNDFETAERSLCVNAAEIGNAIRLNEFDLAVVMSHHLASDRSYLAQLAHSTIGYIGLLGPPGRRNRLLSELGDAANALRPRLRGPAGLDLGGRGPAAIALSIVAEMQQHLAAT
ncbi:MAG TPA: XdhC family protein [Woeseiaceae bacterium]|nr:XdhC family protein [Woeseiaceae bacterium]